MRVIPDQVNVVVQASVFRAAQGVVDDELTDEAQVSEFNDFTGWPCGFPHQINLVMKQVQASLGTLEALI